MVSCARKGVRARDAVLLSLLKEQARCCSLACQSDFYKDETVEIEPVQCGPEFKLSHRLAMLVKVSCEKVLGGALLIPCRSVGSCKRRLEHINLYPGTKAGWTSSVAGRRYGGRCVMRDLVDSRSDQRC